MVLPNQLLLSDLLNNTVRSELGLDHGPGLMAWMHPPVHRLLGWISKPSAFGDRRQVWRLDQLRGFSELEALVKGVKGGQWYSLMDKVSDPKHLWRGAWQVIRNDGAAGIDHRSCEQLEKELSREVELLSRNSIPATPYSTDKHEILMVMRGHWRL